MVFSHDEEARMLVLTSTTVSNYEEIGAGL